MNAHTIQKRPGLPTLGFLSAVALSLCLATPPSNPVRAQAEKVDDVHPSANVRRLGSQHQIVQDMDRASFDKAIAYYPTASGEPYAVNMADYLFWKLVIAFRSSARPGKVSLSDFSELCTREKAEIGPGSSAICRLSMAVDVTRNGRTTTYSVKATVNTGRWFDPSRKAYRPTIRAEVRGLLDRLVGLVVVRMRRGDLPMK